MPALLLVSLIWALSPGLIKGQLIGFDSGFISAARLGLAFLVFLPLLRPRKIPLGTALALVAIGAVQFGVMYLAYNESFRHLQSYEVALFTLTTPIFVTLLADALERTLHMRALLAALLAVAAAAVVTVKGIAIESTLLGIALVQLSNAAFAIGQVLYRRVRARLPGARDPEIFGWLYLGAFALTVPVMLVQTDFSTFGITLNRLLVLVYLGVVASGLGFFLWNLGATQVSAGLLAVMNNAKIPLMVACSLLIFGEKADPIRLVLSGGLLALAVWLAGKPAARRRDTEP
jgi:drug/metabolite transporter (DMT)-like permease